MKPLEADTNMRFHFDRAPAFQFSYLFLDKHLTSPDYNDRSSFHLLQTPSLRG